MVTTSNSSGTTASKILYSSLVDQLYAEAVNFCSFVRKSNQDVFNSCYRTVTGGEFHRIILKKLIFRPWSLSNFLHLCAPPHKNLQSRYMSFKPPTTLPLSPETTLGNKWTQSFITNFLSFNPPQQLPTIQIITSKI